MSKTKKNKSEMSYEGLDENIVKLVKTLNWFDGIDTQGSCGGHKNNKPYQLPSNQWNVIFKVKPSKKGFIDLEFLVWAINNNLRKNGNDVYISPNSAAPFLNEIGKTLYFALEGEDVAPDKIAEELEKMALEFHRQVI